MIRFLILACLFSVSASANHWHRHHPWNGFVVGYGALYAWHWPGVYAGYGYRFPQSRWASFGSIAYSFETDKIGYASGTSHRGVAESQARYTCGASDCRSVVWVQGGCAAIATSRESRTLGWAYSGNRSTAAYWALASCKRHGGTQCEARAWVCSW